MKKLSLFAASILLGFGLASCKSDTRDGAKKDDKAEADQETAANSEESMATETVSIKVDGMT